MDDTPGRQTLPHPRRQLPIIDFVTGIAGSDVMSDVCAAGSVVVVGCFVLSWCGGFSEFCRPIGLAGFVVAIHLALMRANPTIFFWLPCSISPLDWGFRF